MLNHGHYALLSSALFVLSTGCASIQTEASLQQSSLQEDIATLQEEVTGLQDEVDSSTLRIDYIDDRTDERIEEMDEAFDNRLDEIEERRFDEIEEERSSERYRSSESPIRQLSFLAGFREFSDGDLWDRVDAETTLGFEYAQEVDNGLGFEVGAMGSIGTNSGDTGNLDITGAAAELYGGARYFFEGNESWRPYVGGGLSAILAGVDNDVGGQVADDQDLTFGLYLHGGVQYNLNDAIFLALDLRTLLGTDLELETTNGDADYVQLGLVFGFQL